MTKVNRAPLVPPTHEVPLQYLVRDIDSIDKDACKLKLRAEGND